MEPAKRTEEPAGGLEPAALLAQVNNAIAAVLCGGQSYKLGSRSLTRADLALLRSMRADLEAQVDQENSGPLLGRACVAFFEGR